MAGEYGVVHFAEELVQPETADEVRTAVGEVPVGGPGGAGDTVGQGRVLGDHVDDVHPEPVDAAVEPTTASGRARRRGPRGFPS
jgi:hypothetical protein